MKNHVSQGLTMDYTAIADISSGDAVLAGTILGIAITDIAAGEAGTVSVEGVYSLPKASVAISQGEQLYWDSSAESVTSESTDNTPCGKAFGGAALGDGVIDIKINV